MEDRINNVEKMICIWSSPEKNDGDGDGDKDEDVGSVEV
jgi:hypothetical protein